MQIVPFLTHYQLVYASFYFSSFSLISYTVICINLHGNLTQVTAQDDRSEGIEVIKWLRESRETALQKHGKCVLISVWSQEKVLKMRKNVDSRGLMSLPCREGLSYVNLF